MSLGPTVPRIRENTKVYPQLLISQASREGVVDNDRLAPLIRKQVR
jgi:hypothetical protein